ncbi:type II toxin-antitoxin system Rv0910 family toxin [Nocardia nova]|uniref:type II toxin-antitoxin system Rv0910 family toxin n=1 Tax=Nocardia nova TaxID=37330 RepID=UPI0033EB71B4
MAKVEKTLELAAAPEKVWEVLSDPSRFGEWLGMHKKWKSEPPTTLVQGTELPEAVINLMNMANTFQWTVAEVNAPSSATLTATGMAAVKVTLEIAVAPAAAGATVTVAASFDGALIKGALAKAAEKAAGDDIEDSFHRLQALVA